jgi:opacity protein-like surface antigen
VRTALMASVSCVALALAASTQPSAADEFGAGWGSNWYVSLFGGGTFADAVEDYYGYVYDTRLKDGFTFGGAVGTLLYPGLRGEIELSWQQNQNRDTRPFVAPRAGLPGDTDVTFVFANLWKDFGHGMVRPYVGGGVGVGMVDTDSDIFGLTRIDDDGVGFAGQLGAGLRIPVTDRLASPTLWAIRTRPSRLRRAIRSTGCGM